jgi:hypothetical protein
MLIHDHDHVAIVKAHREGDRLRATRPMRRVLQIAPSTRHAHAACQANPDKRSKRARAEKYLEGPDPGDLRCQLRRVWGAHPGFPSRPGMGFSAIQPAPRPTPRPSGTA